MNNLRYPISLLAALALPLLGRAEEHSPSSPAHSVPKVGGSESQLPSLADLERFQTAFKVIDTSTDTQELVRAMDVIRQGLPGSRSVLHEQLSKGSLKQRCFALQVLGENGTAEDDLKVVAPALKDPRIPVRLAAVMALRKLGKEGGLKPLLAYLPGEEDANNRKMAIKTLQHWGDKGALPALVRILKGDQDAGVRNFALTALEFLTRKSFGKDVAAWEEYVESEANREQALELLRPKAEKEGKKP